MEKKRKKPTISIGIPAYNEELNIGKLIKEILSQDQKNFSIDKIIIASDGSNDNTIEEAKKFNLSEIEIFENKERRGVAVRMNQIFKHCNSEILILLNADIAVPDKFFINKIIQPIIEDRADLVSADLMALKAETFIGKVLKTSFDFKKTIFQNYKKGLNLFTCYGAGRAFSKNLYRSITFTESVGEDAYSYLYCLKNGFKYANMKDAKIYIKLPDNLLDHKKQSLRFNDSKERFNEIFGKDFIRKEYHLPIGLILKKAITCFFRRPLLMTFNVLVTLYMRILSLFSKKSSNVWDISISTKDHNINKNKQDSILLRLSKQVFFRRTLYRILRFVDDVLFLKNKMIVLCYHGVNDKKESFFDVSVEDFKKQINLLLKEGYVFVDSKEFYKLLKKRDESNVEKVCLLTFDDGYKDVLVVREFLLYKKIKPLIFVLSDKERVSREALGSDKEFLAKNDIEVLKKDGWKIGSHSATHKDFKDLSAEELDEEIRLSKKKLEEKYDLIVESFAYPKGFYDKEIKKIVRSAGYLMGFSMDDGIIRGGIDVFSVPRIGINSSHANEEFLTTFSPSVVIFRKLIKLFL